MEAALTALLAPVAGGRSYWGRKPQSAPGTPQVEPARPYIVLQRISSQTDYTYDGASGYVAQRVQVDVYADHWTTARSTAKAIKSIVSGYRSGSIQAVFVENEQDLPAAAPGETTTLFRTSIDLMVHHQETLT